MISFFKRVNTPAPLLASCAFLSIKPAILSFFSKSSDGSARAHSEPEMPEGKREAHVFLKMRQLWTLDLYSRKVIEDLVSTTADPTGGDVGDSSRNPSSVTPDVAAREKAKDRSFSGILKDLDVGVASFITDVALRTKSKADATEPLPAKEISADILDLIPSSVLDDKSKSTLRVLSVLGDKLLSQIKQSYVNLQHPFLINIGLLRLFILQSSATTRPASRVSETELTEHFLAEAKHFLRYSADVYQESPYISTEDILLNNLQEQFSQVGKNVKIPRHIVFLDHLTKSIVVSIRGTGSVSDVLTDLHFDAIPLYEPPNAIGLRDLVDKLSGRDQTTVYAHSGITHSATALKVPVLEAIRTGMSKRGGKYRKYSVVFTGHSLGAGTACLLSMLVSKEAEFPVKTFAFAPPPVISREGTTSVKRSFLTGSNAECSIYSFVHDNDVVTRASHNEFLNLLSAVACIDKLTWTPKERILKLMQGKLTPDEIAEISTAIKNSKNTEFRQQNDGVELLIPGRIFWLVPKIESSVVSVDQADARVAVSGQEAAENSNKFYEVLSVEDPDALFNGAFLTGDSMIADHQISSYMNSMVNLDTSSSCP